MPNYERTIENVVFLEHHETESVFDSPDIKSLRGDHNNNQSTNNKTPNDWSEEHKRMFMSACKSGIKSSGAPISNSDIHKICDCELDKVQKKYPNPNVQFSPEVLMKINDECGRAVLGL